jgi:hypothetical protein
MTKAKARVLYLAILAVLIVDGAVTSPASATQWLVSGVAFNGEESIGATLLPGAGLVHLTTHLPGGELFVKGCEGFALTGAKMFGKNKGQAESLTLTKCKVDHPVGCKTNSQIVIKPTVAEAVDLVAGVEPVYVTFTPKTGNEFVTVIVEGCAAEGIYKAVGRAACKVFQPTVSAVMKLCSFEQSLYNSVRFGVSTAVLEGTVGVLLTGAKKGLPVSVNP